MSNKQPDKHLVAKSFGQAAAAYDDVAVLQQQTGDELLDRLSLVALKPERVLDLGVGTGRNLGLLASIYPKAQLFALDIAEGMLKQAKQSHQNNQGFIQRLAHKKPYYIGGDAEQLPLQTSSIDLVFANLSLQWCDLTRSLTEISRVLRPGGLLTFTTLGPDSLHELRAAWASVDQFPHINTFYDMHDIGEAMMNSGLAEPVLDVERHCLTYDDAMGLMKDLKTLGASNLNSERRRGLTGKQTMKHVIAAYESFRKEGSLPATYEVVYGHAWGAIAVTKVNDKGEAIIPISQIQRSR